MSKNTFNTGTVPTVRYRVLAVVFFLIAVAGLFVGYLGTWLTWFNHSNVILDPLGANIAIGEGAPLKGTLFGYLVAVFKFYFIDGGFFAGFLNIFSHASNGTPAVGAIIANLICFSQFLFLILAVLISLGFGIASCLTKQKVARGFAMASGIIVTLAYLWPLVVGVFAAGAFTANVEGAFTGVPLPFGVTLYFDLPLLVIAGLCLLILFVTAIARRKWTGVINVVLCVLTIAVAYAFIHPSSSTYEILSGTLHGTLSSRLVKLIYLFMVLVIVANLLLSVVRINAKKFYPFDAVRYGLLFVGAFIVVVDFILQGPSSVGVFANGNEMPYWDMFTSHPIFTSILLGGSLIAFGLSIGNAFIVIARRNKNKAKRIKAKLMEDSIDKSFESDEQVAFSNNMPVDPIDGPMGAPMGAPMPGDPAAGPMPGGPFPGGPMPGPAGAPMGAPMGGPMPGPAGAPMGAPVPGPAGAPMSAPMGAPMGGAMAGAVSGTIGVGGSASAQQQPIIVQQAPATPPVVVLQLPPYYPPQQQTYIMPQPVMMNPAAFTPAPVFGPAQKPAQQNNAQQGEENVSDFERKMIELARKTPTPAAPAAPTEEAEAPAEETEAAPAPAPILADLELEPAPAYVEMNDPFFDSLTSEQQDEFRSLFIAKAYGDFGLPEYTVGGDNAEFFKKVFSALDKFRSRISPDLLDKIYDETNK